MAQSSKSTNYQYDFRICSNFSGKSGAFVKKCLRKFEYNIQDLKNAKRNIWPLGSRYIAQASRGNQK